MLTSKEITDTLRKVRFTSNKFLAFEKAKPLLNYLASKTVPNGDDLITPEYFFNWENSEVLDDTVILARLTFAPTPPYVGSVDLRASGTLTLNGTPLSSVKTIQQFFDLMHLLGVKRKEPDADCKTDPEISFGPSPGTPDVKKPGC
jgi:hypothetical protein